MMSSHRISARLILYTRFKIQGKQLENVQKQQFQFKPTIEILPKTTSAHFWSQLTQHWISQCRTKHFFNLIFEFEKNMIFDNLNGIFVLLTNDLPRNKTKYLTLQTLIYKLKSH